MATKLTKYTTPSANHDIDRTDLCLEQEIFANTPLKLNGDLSNIIQTEIDFLDHGYSRTIYILPNGNIGSISFIITGEQNNTEISESITVSNSKKESVNIYDKIFSIIPTSNGGGGKEVSVSIGDDGFFRPINPNSKEFTLTVVNDNKNKLKKLILYGALEDINGTYQEAIANIPADRRSSDLEEIDSKTNVEYYRLEGKDTWLADFILVYFEKNNPTDSRTTLRFLEFKE